MYFFIVNDNNVYGFYCGIRSRVMNTTGCAQMLGHIIGVDVFSFDTFGFRVFKLIERFSISFPLCVQINEDMTKDEGDTAWDRKAKGSCREPSSDMFFPSLFKIKINR